MEDTENNLIIGEDDYSDQARRGGLFPVCHARFTYYKCILGGSTNEKACASSPLFGPMKHITQTGEESERNNNEGPTARNY